MYGNVDKVLLWLILLDKYFINKCNLKRSKADSCILYKKYDNGKLELAMSVYVDYMFMARNMEILEKIKGLINLKVNIQKYGKAKKFLGVYYEWVHDKKGLFL